MNEANTSGPTKMETLLGGNDLTVDLLDGTRATVRIRQITVRQCNDMVKMIGDEPKEVEFYASQPEGWADTLTQSSYELTLAEGRRLNADFFWRWAERRKAAMEQLAPGMVAKAVQLATEKPLTTSPSAPSSAA